MKPEDLENSPLGRNTAPVSGYDPAQLCPIMRRASWQDYGHEQAPWTGWDIWNAWEVSWLNARGLPQVAVGEIRVPASSPRIIESKSLKLYLNSFAQTKFDSLERVRDTIARDLTASATAPVDVALLTLDEAAGPVPAPRGTCVDHLDIGIDQYRRNSSLLACTDERVEGECLYSHLLKTNCPVTGQPDWGSVCIRYSGRQIDKAGLLRYIVSCREETDFHELCTELFFLDIMQVCRPDALTVFTRYLRRGGLDINPWRSTETLPATNERLVRQ